MTLQEIINDLHLAVIIHLKDKAEQEDIESVKTAVELLKIIADFNMKLLTK